MAGAWQPVALAVFMGFFVEKSHENHDYWAALQTKGSRGVCRELLILDRDISVIAKMIGYSSDTTFRRLLKILPALPL
jgi:hypothetical protein